MTNKNKNNDKYTFIDFEGFLSNELKEQLNSFEENFKQIGDPVLILLIDC